MKVKMTVDGTKLDHNKQDIEDQNKETKALTADGGSMQMGVGNEAMWGRQALNQTQATTRTRMDESTPRRR